MRKETNSVRVVQYFQIESIGKWVITIRSIRSICHMENSQIRLQKSRLPLDCCISLARLRKISPYYMQKGPINFCRFGRFLKWKILIFDWKSPAFHWTVAFHQGDFEKYRRSRRAPQTFVDSIDSVDLSNGNCYIRLEKSSFPLDCCISLARLVKISLSLQQDP